MRFMKIVVRHCFKIKLNWIRFLRHASSGMWDPFLLQGRTDHVYNDMQVRSSQQERVGYVTPANRITCATNVLAADPFQAQRQVGLLRLNVGFVCWTYAVVEGVVQEN